MDKLDWNHHTDVEKIIDTNINWDKFKDRTTQTFDDWIVTRMDWEHAIATNVKTRAIYLVFIDLWCRNVAKLGEFPETHTHQLKYGN